MATTLTTMPTAFLNQENSSDIKYKDLQQQMIDNSWEPVESSDQQVSFKHKRYGNKLFPCHVHITKQGEKLMFPMASHDDDPYGLACSIHTNHGVGISEIVSNEWVSYWDTRTGKRKEKYLIYLARRQKKREEIEKEEAKAKKQAEMMKAML